MSISNAMTSLPDTCCYRSSLSGDNLFCTECGKPIFRCMAAAECSSLLDDSGVCPVCIAPGLYLDASAACAIHAGEKLALPLIIANESSVGRPLFVNGLWMDEGDGELSEISLPFQRLDPGKQATVGVRSSVLTHPGVHRIDLLIALATRFEWREEEYVFSSAILFPVESKDPSGPVTNITVQADEIGAGMTIYNPTRIENEREENLNTRTEPIALATTRADVAERQLKRRGYPSGKIAPHTVEFSWRGFNDADAPFDGMLLKPSGRLNFGRNAIEPGVSATDVRLIVYNRNKTGGDQIDRDRSLAISRQHFSVYVERGRLMMHVDSQFGARVNGEAYGRTKTVVLNDGDVIEPIVKNPDALRLKVSFETQHDTIHRIVFIRQQA